MARIADFTTRGNYRKTDRFLHGLMEMHYARKMEKYGRRGVEALRAATPRDSGETANSWSYEIIEQNGKVAVQWKNSHIERGVNIAVILQYGHATRNGGFVEGRDYINPAMRPIFDEMAKEAWREVIEA